MRLSLLAIGTRSSASEDDLVRDYVQRATAGGRALGLGPVTVQTIDAKKPGKGPEAEALTGLIPSGARRIMLDERGKLMSSRDFASTLARWRDDGVRDTVLIIGGADGLDADFRATADLTLSFGPMVWPHMLVRVMVAEQIYRAISILAGAPYHRD
jgi:23S rRNA (pseudouridine1915-N3)-methyltransferase